MKSSVKVVLLLLIVSCTNIKDPIFDEELGLRKSDVVSVSKNNTDFIPEFSKLFQSKISDMLVPAPAPAMGNGQLISFSITEEVPIKDVFIELSRLTDVDIQIDPDIDINVIFKATDKTLDVIIDNLCNIGNLKYEYKDNILKIERDVPYLKDYNVDILIEHELWNTIKDGINNILITHNEIYNKVITRLNNKVNNKQQENIEQQNFSKLQAVDEKYVKEDFKILINKPASLVTIYADKKTQEAVEKYIEKAKINYGAQVLIEAKVVEVNLKDEFKAGINWSLNEVRDSKINAKVDNDDDIAVDTVINGKKYSKILDLGTSAVVSGGLKTLDIASAVGSKDLNVIVSALEEFGTTRTLSSPRVTSLNNQMAKLDFLKNLVYFSVEREEEDDDDTGVTKYTYTSTKQEETEGVILEIIPSINLQTNEITLKVKPELRTKYSEVQDPNPDIENRVPEIQTKKIETSLKIESGNVMVIGGLMSEETNNVTNGIPFLKDIPILGWLFKYKSKQKNIIETVIFIKATIIDRSNPLNHEDKMFYDKFINKSVFAR